MLRGGNAKGKRGFSRIRNGWLRTVLLHDLQELDDDLGARPDHDLAFAGLLRVVDGVERIVQDAGADHICGLRFSTLSAR